MKADSVLSPQSSVLDTRVVRPAPRLRGEITVPGDKSISHRALILNAIAEGTATITNLGPGADCTSTMRCLRAMGVEIQTESPQHPAHNTQHPLSPQSSIRIAGQGLRGLSEPPDVLDAGNSGTTTRLLTGLLAGQGFFSAITGDSSLRGRPMKRVVEPLRRMGAQIWGRGDGSLLPLAIRGGDLDGIDYAPPVASAQLKSALLLAGLCARGTTTVREIVPTRDHTERMLRAQGADLLVDGTRVAIASGTPLRPISLRVPGDISSAAFWLVAAAIHPDAEVVVRDVGINPGRTGVLEALRRMGADLEVIPKPERAGEPVADIVARSSKLRGIEIAGDLVPRLIDEIPILAVAAVFADGDTVVRDASELRVKETDRIAAVAGELRRMGAEVRETKDGFAITGTGALVGARCESQADHRMAMSLAIAALVAREETTIAGAGAADVSYPSFWTDLAALSGRPL